jgi:shikimate dehydrogenase
MADRLLFTLLGHPVGHSVSPAMCAAGFAALGLPHVYTAIDVPTEAGLGRVVDDLRNGMIAGSNVTVPYKRAVIDLADRRAESAEEVGAANVLAVDGARRVVAHNTDADALAEDLASALGDRPRASATVIGAGGAGLAAIVACRRLGFHVVSVTSRSWTSTETMFDAPAAQRARELGALTVLWPEADTSNSGRGTQALRLQWSELVVSADCVVQATSAGMRGGDPGQQLSRMIPWARLPSHAVAYDLVYNPRLTPFLREAHRHGLVAEGGLGMLVRQAVLSIGIWTGQTPPYDVMRVAAEEALAGGPATR